MKQMCTATIPINNYDRECLLTHTPGKIKSFVTVTIYILFLFMRLEWRALMLGRQTNKECSTIV